MVEVFKTSVEHQVEAKILLATLSLEFSHLEINLDLSDCDKVLRVEGNDFEPEQIINFFIKNNYQCEVMID